MRVYQLIRKILFYLLFRNQFKYLDFRSSIQSPLRIEGMKNISISKGVIIQYKTWLAAIPLTGYSKCTLEIGQGSIIGNFNHIYSTCSIKIGENVLTADKVYISDNTHEYSNVLQPIMYQPIKQIGFVEIGDGSWIGENVCVLGAKIGKNCVIGANSVVVHDIPDYSVAVGAPAKVIKFFNLKTNIWEKYHE